MTDKFWHLVVLHKKELVIVSVICLFFATTFAFMVKTVKRSQILAKINEEKKYDLRNLRRIQIVAKNIKLKGMKENVFSLDIPFNDEGKSIICSYYENGLVFVKNLSINRNRIRINGSQVVQE